MNVNPPAMLTSASSYSPSRMVGHRFSWSRPVVLALGVIQLLLTALMLLTHVVKYGTLKVIQQLSRERPVRVPSSVSLSCFPHWPCSPQEVGEDWILIASVVLDSFLQWEKNRPSHLTLMVLYSMQMWKHPMMVYHVSAVLEQNGKLHHGDTIPNMRSI